VIGIDRDLEARAEERRPIRFAIVGAGQMGADIVSQVRQMKGIEVAAVADLELSRAKAAYEIAGIPPERVLVAKSLAQAQDAARQGKLVACDRADWIPRIETVESVVDATGAPEAGAQIALECFKEGKHVVMMNVEADVTIGPLLARRAGEAGVIYTLAAGDEPAALMELYCFAGALGLEIVAAGKGKNNPLDRDAVPDAYEAEARRRGLNPMMLVEFVDGSKTMIEMGCVANATGLVPDVPDMHGPRTSVPELKEVFRLKEDAVGQVAPGVFVIVATDHPRLRQCLVLRDMGHGPAYTLFRPFHLCSMEVPLTVALISLHGRATMQPREHLVVEVTAIAKRDLKPGDVLDGIGGRTHRAGLRTYGEARRDNALPIGLAKGCKVKCPISKGSLLKRDAVEPVPGSLVHELRAEQDGHHEEHEAQGGPR
jgi:predicted homoserine dehydrogenase-like protein